MAESRLTFRVDPEQYEDVYGYLIRVAEANYLPGPDAILHEVFGARPKSLTYSELPQLAYFCRLYSEEMVHLSGIARREGASGQSWQVSSHWISKEPFIVGRRARICPGCLLDSPYIRGFWNLSFYTACSRHHARLVDCCPACLGVIRWNRHALCHCGCGAAFTGIPTLPADGDSLCIARLIERVCGEGVVLHPCDGIGPALHSHLADLSLDGLCKTIWFLGDCFSQLSRFDPPGWRRRPTLSGMDIVIASAFDALRDWPLRFLRRIDACQERLSHSGMGSASLIYSLLGPVQRYFEHELQGTELNFLRCVYEQHVRYLWRTFGSKHRRRRYDRQLEFDF